MGLPFSAPASIFNGRIHAQRGYATQLYALSELRVLARSAGVAVNDIVLAICGGAIRRYLIDLDCLPAKPLTAGIPVSFRAADNDETGNALTFIIATLATTTADPQARLRKIAASTRHAKRSLNKLSAAAITQYTIALMAPYVLSLVSGMAGRTRPVFNVTVSNLPGPAKPLYIRGAKMEAFYPTSLVTHGQALNITVHGYADTMGFGFIACRDTVPNIQRLAHYAGQSLNELRVLYGEAATEPETKAVASSSR
jgi:WS/DGAT/MGAT family acyltransferase